MPRVVGGAGCLDSVFPHVVGCVAVPYRLVGVKDFDVEDFAHVSECRFESLRVLGFVVAAVNRVSEVVIVWADGDDVSAGGLVVVVEDGYFAYGVHGVSFL